VSVDLFVMLAAPEFDEHKRRLHGPSHLHRQTTEADFANVRLIDQFLGDEAARWGISYEPYGSGVDKFMRVLVERASV
jgi:hypothetical protein